MGEMSLLLSPYGRIYASEYRVGIGSDNGLAPNRRHAIILTNAGLLSFEPLGTNFCEILIKIQIQIQIQIFYWLTKRDRLYQKYKQKLKHTRIHKKKQENDTKWKTWRDEEILTRVFGVGARTLCILKTSYDSYIIGILLNKTHISYIHVPLSRTV